MEDEGIAPPDERGARYFRHDRLPGDAEDAGVVSREQAQTLDFLRGVRIKADY